MFRRKAKNTASPHDAQLEHQRLTSLINSMADAVVAIDESKRIVVYNAATLNIFNVNTIEAGTLLSDLFQPVDKNNQQQDINLMIGQATTPITNRDLRLKYNDGSLINLYISIAPVHLGYGEQGQRGHVILLRDITHEKSLEEERDEFISVVSHELRTPVTIAEGDISNAMLMADRNNDIAPIKQALKEAHNQVLFLADMINDLSTLSRAEQGTLKLELEPIDVRQLVQELVGNYTKGAQQKGLTLSAEVSPDVAQLRSSKLYVREILQNFITNAIKYTERGGIKISVAPGEQGVIFGVTDTGIGISKADQEQVFDKFFRSEDYRTKQAKGTGLGLYVTMKLARLIHADIQLQSELNRGSTFTITIPQLD